MTAKKGLTTCRENTIIGVRLGSAAEEEEQKSYSSGNPYRPVCLPSLLLVGLLTLCLRCVHGVVGFLALMSAVFSTLINLHATMLFVRASASCCSLLHHSISILFSFCASLRACNSTSSRFSGAQSAHDHTHCGSRCVPPHDHRVSASRCVARSRFSRYCGAYHPFQGTAPPGVVLSVASQTNNVSSSRLAGFKVRPSSIRVRQQP